MNSEEFGCVYLNMYILAHIKCILLHLGPHITTFLNQKFSLLCIFEMHLFDIEIEILQTESYANHFKDF